MIALLEGSLKDGLHSCMLYIWYGNAQGVQLLLYLSAHQLFNADCLVSSSPAATLYKVERKPIYVELGIETTDNQSA